MHLPTASQYALVLIRGEVASSDFNTSIEFVLKPGVQFSPHQPTEKEGRLVIDLKPATK